MASAVVFRDVHLLFNTILEQKGASQEALGQLLQLFTLSPAEFSKSIQNILLKLLPIFRKERAADYAFSALAKVLAEVRRLATTPMKKDVEKFWNALMQITVVGCESANALVRQGSAWVLEKLIVLGDGLQIAEVHIKAAEKCTETMLRDKNNQVKLRAVFLASLLDKQPELLRASLDPVKEIRRQAVLLLDSNSLEAFAERAQDREEVVRLAAVERLSRCSAEDMPIEIRRVMLSASLKDRSASVRKAAADYWTAHFQGKSFEEAGKEFLSLVGLQTLPSRLESAVCSVIVSTFGSVYTPDVLEQYMKIALTSVDLNSPDQLSETLLLVRLCSDFLSKDKDLTGILPRISQICEIVLDAKDKIEPFCLQQLLLISLNSDIGEEFARRELIGTCSLLSRELILEHSSKDLETAYIESTIGRNFVRTRNDLVRETVSTIRKLLIGQDHEFSRVIVESINDLREPFDEEQGVHFLRDNAVRDVKSLEEEIEELNAEMYRLEDSQCFEEALLTKRQLEEAIARKEVMEQRRDECVAMTEAMLRRCLILTSELLRNMPQTDVQPECEDLVKTLVHPALSVSSVELQTLAMECLSLFCLLDVKLCKDYLYLFKLVLRPCSEAPDPLMEFIAIRAVCDFFLAFDLLNEEISSETVILDEDASLKTSAHTMLQTVLQYLGNPDPHLQVVVIEGVAKLLLFDRVPKSTAILAKLLLLFFEIDAFPATKQVLHVFFTTYSLLSSQHSANLAEAFKMLSGALLALFNTNQSAEMTQQNLSRAFSFVFSFLSPEYLRQQGKFLSDMNYHFDLFYFFAKQIVASKDLLEGKVYPRMVTLTSFTEFTSEQTWLASELLNQIAELLTDKQSLKCIIKTNEALQRRIEIIGTGENEEYSRQAEEAYKATLRNVDLFKVKLESEDVLALYTPFKQTLSDSDPYDTEIEEVTPPAKRPIRSTTASQKRPRLSIR